MGRAHWMPSSRGIASLAQDEQGANGIYVQDFVPGRDTARTRRQLGGFNPDVATETFSTGGTHLLVAGWDQLFGLVLAESIPAAEPWRSAR